jgi:Tfp pilus assembly protein PilF
VELSPENAELHYVLGGFLVRSGKFDEAVEHLTRAMELRPGYEAAEKDLLEARAALRAQRPTAE